MPADTVAHSAARRVDRAVDALLEARPPLVVEPELRGVIAAAAAIRAAHPLVPPGATFEEGLRARLRLRAAGMVGEPAWPRALAGIRNHRLLFAGAVGSAAVSVAGVTALAVWRAAHGDRGARS